MDPLLNALGNVQSGDFAVKLRGALAIQAEKELLAEFRGSVDPYGNPWAPVARGGKPLMDTGNLRGSRVATVTDDGIEVGLAAPYASYQQFGTGGLKRRGLRDAQGRFLRKSFAADRARARKGGIRPREMLPISRGLDGSTWEASFGRVTDSVVGAALK